MGFEVKFRIKFDRTFKAILIQQNAFSGHFRALSPIGALCAKDKPKGTRKLLFEPKSTCILEKVTYPLAPTSAAARVDFGKDLTAKSRQS